MTRDANVLSYAPSAHDHSRRLSIRSTSVRLRNLNQVRRSGTHEMDEHGSA